MIVLFPVLFATAHAATLEVEAEERTVTSVTKSGTTQTMPSTMR